MLAGNFINTQLSALRKTDTVETALDYMMTQGVVELPIIENQKLYNYARMQMLHDASPQLKLEEIIPANPHSIVVTEAQHLYDIVPLFRTYDLQVIVVQNEVGDFAGILDMRKVHAELTNTLTYKGVGAIIMIECENKDFAPSQIARLIEENGAKMLGMMCNHNEDGQLQISIKLNSVQIQNIVATLQRFNYRVIHFYNADDMHENREKDFDSVFRFFDL